VLLFPDNPSFPVRASFFPAIFLFFPRTVLRSPHRPSPIRGRPPRPHFLPFFFFIEKSGLRSFFFFPVMLYASPSSRKNFIRSGTAFFSLRGCLFPFLPSTLFPLLNRASRPTQPPLPGRICRRDENPRSTSFFLSGACLKSPRPYGSFPVSGSPNIPRFLIERIFADRFRLLVLSFLR